MLVESLSENGIRETIINIKRIEEKRKNTIRCFTTYEEYFERVLKEIKEAFQSDIVEASGISKSKVSVILANLKKQGKIIKIKAGKENIIRWIETK